ncbi:MAG: hypothetical protein HZB71_12090 [Betaproteobacteria bacterium]|nr:hypothetical protein [Betaproteobacteria bacterium]
MNEPSRGPHFWIGNVLLALALAVLLFMERLWPLLGSLTMVLWMILAGAGIYLVTRDKGPPGANMPN